MKTFATTALLLTFVIGAPLEALATDGAALETLVVTSANAAGDHQALASFYRDKAADARKRAATERSVARHQSGGKLFHVSAQKAQHIARARQLEEAAAEFERLAASHAKHVVIEMR